MKARLVGMATLAWASVLETTRRKDIYVVWLLCVFMLFAGALIRMTGTRGVEIFLRDVSLTAVNLLSILLCIVLAARQLPEELSRRTLYPLLARPVRRFDLLAAKFLAVWAMSTFALLSLGVIAWLNLALFGVPVGRVFWQFLLVRSLSFGVVAALVLALSLFVTQSANITLSACLVLGATTFGRAVELVYDKVSPAAQVALKGVYYAVPHLDLFDLSKKVAFGWPPVPFWVVGALALYACAYALLFLSVGAMRFQRQAL